jgi:type VI protein secretion system component Hcp
LVPVMSHRTNGKYIHLEEISFEYGEIYWEYTPYNDSGPTGSPVTTGWSVIENIEK